MWTAPYSRTKWGRQNFQVKCEETMNAYLAEEGKLALLWLSRISTSIESLNVTHFKKVNWELERKITFSNYVSWQRRGNWHLCGFQESPLQSRAASLCLPMTPGRPLVQIREIYNIQKYIISNKKVDQYFQQIFLRISTSTEGSQLLSADDIRSWYKSEQKIFLNLLYVLFSLLLFHIYLGVCNVYVCVCVIHIVYCVMEWAQYITLHAGNKLEVIMFYCFYLQ